MTESRIRSLVIAGILLTTLPFLSILADLELSFWAEDRTLFFLQLASLLGSVLGFAGVVLFSWQIVLGSRFLRRYISDDSEWSLRVHKWIGTYGITFIFAHPFLETYAFGERWLFLAWPSARTAFETYVTFGRLAFLCFIIIFVTSAILRGRLKYRPWKYIHYLAYPMVGLAMLHSLNISPTLATHPVLNAVWIGLLSVTAAFMFFRLLKVFGIGKVQYRVTSLAKVGQDDVIVLRLSPITASRFLQPRVGQYCYLQIGRFAESHPFSVMVYEESSHEIVLGIKALGPYTRKVMDIAEGATVFIDGPYGVFTREGQSTAPKVLIAGGIGITPFVDLVLKHGNDATYMINCNTSLEYAVYRDEMRRVLGDRYVDILSEGAQQALDPQTRNENQVVFGTLNEEMIASHIPQKVLQTANIFFCGSPRFYAAAKQMLMKLGIPEDRIFYEKFSL